MSDPIECTDPRPLRRNDVVWVAGHGEGAKEFWFFGRVNRVVDEDHFEVVCTGRHFMVYTSSQLKRILYKGRYDRKYDPATGSTTQGIYRRMPTLRKLKQRAAYYYKDVWKRNR